MFKLVKSPTVKHSLYTVGFRSLCSPVRSGFFSITLLVCVVEGISRVTTMSFIVATDAHCHSILAETTAWRDRQTDRSLSSADDWPATQHMPLVIVQSVDHWLQCCDTFCMYKTFLLHCAQVQPTTT